MKLSVPQEQVMVIDVQHILTWSQCCYLYLFMSASDTVRTAFLGQSLMLTSVNYGHVSELFKILQFKVYAMWMVARLV